MQVQSDLRTPSGVNGAASLVAQSVAPGLRVSTPPKFSNLDCSGLRLVKRGRTVRTSKGHGPGKVVKVRTGSALVAWSGGALYPNWWPCRLLAVLDLPV